MPDEFDKAQRAHLDSKLGDDKTYKNAAEVLSAHSLTLNPAAAGLKQKGSLN